MDDEEYVAVLRDFLIHPEAPWLLVETVEVVPGRYGDELEVGFSDVSPHTLSGSVRMPFDAEWRRLSGYDEPGVYGPHVLRRVERAAQDLHTGSRPPRTSTWDDLVAALVEEGAEVTEVAPGRADVRLGDRRVTVVIEPGEAFVVDTGEYDELPLVGSLDDDEHFLVAWEGEIRGSTRAELPPVKGHARWRQAQEFRRQHPGGAWYAHTPPDPGQ